MKTDIRTQARVSIAFNQAGKKQFRVVKDGVVIAAYDNWTMALYRMQQENGI